MQKRKGLSGWLTAVLTAAVLLSGGISVYAEPSEGWPAEDSYTENQSSLYEPSTESETSFDTVSVPEVSDNSEEELSVPDDTVSTTTDWPEESEPSVVETEESQYSDPYHNVTIHPTESSYDDDTDEQASSGFANDNENEDYLDEFSGYTESWPDVSDSEPMEPERDTSALDISDYEMSDVETLTSQDWEDLKKAQQETSHFEMNPTPTTNHTNSAFDKMKKESTGGNDDWIFLVWGIGLIVLGAAVIIIVAVSVIRTKKKIR